MFIIYGIGENHKIREIWNRVVSTRALVLAWGSRRLQLAALFDILRFPMSIEALHWAWQQISIKPTEKLTLLAIADHADELGRNAFPSRSRLAKKTGLAEATITRAIKSLERKGEIRVERAKSRAGDFDHNEYTLPIENVTISRGVGSQRDNLNGGGWAQGVTRVGSQCAPNLPYNLKNKNIYPPDFTVSEEMKTLAKKKGWPDPGNELEAFRDHHVAKGNKFLDWEAAFRTWLRNAKKWKKDRIEDWEPPEVRALRK